jgi:hypothetical protein
MAKSKTQTYKFTGKASWAKVYEADEFRGSRNFKIDVYLDETELKKRKDAGIQSKTYENEEGVYVQFKRPEVKLISGTKQIFAPPKILDKDGNVLVEYKKNDTNTGFDRIGEPVLIGNGSVVEVVVSVYDTSMGKGQRLESVRIIDLIEYSGDGNSDFGDRIVVGGSEEPKAEGVKAPW